MPSQQSSINHWIRLAKRSGVDGMLRRSDLKGSLRVVPSFTTAVVEGSGEAYSIIYADFKFRISEVVLNGEAAEVMHYDRIEALGNEYEVMPTNGERHYDPADHYGVIGRVHTQLIGPVPASVILVQDTNDQFVRDASERFAGAINADAS